MAKTTHGDKDSPPIHEHQGSWWFWNIEYKTRIGPYPTEKDASRDFLIYCEWLMREEKKKQWAHLKYGGFKS
jgi:hypothetical protein